MSSRLVELFEDLALAEKIKRRLPYLFTLAEIESSRAGKVGMEVGSLREKILIALLMYKFGEENVETEIPITEPEMDVKLFGEPVSIKTITGTGGVKAVWTVDPQKAREFLESYSPSCDILLTQIKWDEKTVNENTRPGERTHPGGLFWFPIEAQEYILREMGKERYLKLPKQGTNPRGVEISKEGLLRLLQDQNSRCIPIVWHRDTVSYN